MDIIIMSRYVYEGYLYSSTVDVDSISPADRMYIWTLLTMGYIVPTVLISLSHLTIIGLYRYNNFEVWISRLPEEESRSSRVSDHRLQERNT